MHLKIVTPERTVIDETVDGVQGQAVDGSFGVLPHHVPMITPLEISLITYQKDGQTHKVAVMGGVFRTDGNEVVVLSDSAERGEDIDAARAEHAKQRAESRLRERTEALDTYRAENALKRSLIRLKASGRA